MLITINYVKMYSITVIFNWTELVPRLVWLSLYNHQG